MEDKTPKSENSIFSSVPSGAFVKVLGTEREVKMYAFTDGELSTIGMFSGILNISVAFGFTLVGAYLSATNPNWKWYLLGVAGSVGIGWWAARRRNSEIQRVKNESRAMG